MILTRTKELEEGMVLGKSIYHENGKLLLGAGYRITDSIIKSLLDRGYSHVYISDEDTDQVIPEDVISEELRRQAQADLANKVDKLKNIDDFKNITYDRAKQLLKTGYLKKVDVSFDMTGIVKEIIDDISTAGTKILNTMLFKSSDTFFFDHAINTTIVSVLIGRQYMFTSKELTSLAIGTFLHDIGKIITDQIIENLDESNNHSAEDLYQEHPTFGYLLLQESPYITPMETQIVNQHHELQDGSGFPIGLSGENKPPTREESGDKKGVIFRLAEICCVANVFDNLVVNPLKEEQLTPQDALKKMIDRAGSWYNKSIVETLHKVVPMFPVGIRVRIEDITDPSLVGSYGVVAKINEDNLNRPVLIITQNSNKNKIKPILLDTSKLSRVQLNLII